MTKHTIDSLANNFRHLGINEGDTVFVRADVGKIGRVEGKMSNTILNGILKAVGEDGTIICNSYSKSFFFNKVDPSFVFNRNTPPYTGAFAKIMLEHPESIRSEHPTNSFVAIGKNSNVLLDGHNENVNPYYPIKPLLDLDGKVALIGCVNNSPGFTTVHWAEQELGLGDKTLLKNLYRVYYERNGEKKLYKRTHFGGCSPRYDKFYSYYVKHEILQTGYYGNAYSIAAPAKAVYEIEYSLIKQNPRFTLCDDPDCFHCRGTWLFNKRDMLPFYLRNGIKMLKRLLAPS